MRTLLDITGGLIVAAGIFWTMGAYILSTLTPMSDNAIWIGILIIMFGCLVCYYSARKTCPQCSERVKVKAVKCKHCGSALPAE